MLFIPFIYFLKTRLDNAKAIVFHFFFEWLPIILIAVYSFYSFAFLVELLAYYISFISIYELGYFLNDQLANNKPSERKRVRAFGGLEIFTFVFVRIITFLIITYYVGSLDNNNWWIWYSLLMFVFLIHNLLKETGLKIITFSYLAFARFFSPIVFLVPEIVNINFVLPILIHYVLFRLITYMDSKNLIMNFNRQTNYFRVGFHFIGSAFSVFVMSFANSLVPIWISSYYLLISFGFVIAGTYFLRLYKA